MEITPLIFLERKETCEMAFNEIPVARTKKISYIISNKKIIEKKTNKIGVFDKNTGNYYLVHVVKELTDRMWIDGSSIALNKKMNLQTGFLYKAVQVAGRGFDDVRKEDCNVFTYQKPIKWLSDNAKEVLIVCIQDYDRSNTNIINKQFLVELECIKMN